MTTHGNPCLAFGLGSWLGLTLHGLHALGWLLQEHACERTTNSVFVSPDGLHCLHGFGCLHGLHGMGLGLCSHMHGKTQFKTEQKSQHHWPTCYTCLVSVVLQCLLVLDGLHGSGLHQTDWHEMHLNQMIQYGLHGFGLHGHHGLGSLGWSALVLTGILVQLQNTISNQSKWKMHTMTWKHLVLYMNMVNQTIKH